jgi:hypothetical protein
MLRWKLDQLMALARSGTPEERLAVLAEVVRRHEARAARREERRASSS